MGATGSERQGEDVVWKEEPCVWAPCSGGEPGRFGQVAPRRNHQCSLAWIPAGARLWEMLPSRDAAVSSGLGRAAGTSPGDVDCDKGLNWSLCPDTLGARAFLSPQLQPPDLTGCRTRGVRVEGYGGRELLTVGAYVVPSIRHALSP